MLLELCLRANRGSPQDLLKRALAAQQAGELDLAIENYRQILKTYPKIPEVRSNLGAALAGKGQYADAIEEYQKALALKADPQVKLNLAIAYYKVGTLAKATELLEKLRAAEPSNLQVVTLLADCDLRLGRNKSVIDLLTPLEAADPGNAAFTYLLGTALVRDGQSAKGQLVIDKILRDGDSAEARLLMGTTKMMVRDFAEARTDFEKAVQLNPHLPEVYAYYGQALLATGDQAAARTAFEHELESDPNNFDANLRLGVLHRQDEQSDQAMKYLQHALQIRPGDPGVRYQIASLEFANGQVDQARRDLESLVKDQPDFLEAHVSLATVYFRLKRKGDGDRERATVARLNAERRTTNEIAAKAAQ